MTPEHEKHLADVQQRFAARLDQKYRAGQLEYGNKVWELPNLIDELIDEIVDLAVYAYSLKGQIDGKKTV